ncbi:PXA domain-containing protein [Phycomyces blakesleeanus]|uniref:PXA domain-containing protein n=1 Tax=Phycomyces blakesleeanus TaxID=4837 RepID=A0ABR3BB98_PHYBL
MLGCTCVRNMFAGLSTLLRAAGSCVEWDDPTVQNLCRGLAGYYVVILSIILLADGYLFLVFLGIGFIWGTISKNNSNPPTSHITDASEYHVEHLAVDEPLSEAAFVNEYKTLELFYPPLTNACTQLIEYFLEEFVVSWWKPLNEHGSPDFLDSIRARLNGSVSRLEKMLIKQKRNDLVMATVFGVANTLIIHMRECKAYEVADVPLDIYVEEHPQSPFAQLLSRAEQQNQMRALSSTILRRMLPKTDTDSGVVMRLLRELLATHLFGNILHACSDPDFINSWIVHYLAKDQPMVATEDNTDTEGDIFRDVVEKATEHVIASQAADIEPSISSNISINTNVEKMIPRQLVYAHGTINFSVMDNSPDQGDRIDKETLSFIIQIERPAMEETSVSEGGGYVITRTYPDFEVFHAILLANNPKRVARLGLRLPLDRARSWLKRGNQASAAGPVDSQSIGDSLERYLQLVVADDELGCEPAIVGFLAKERGDSESSFADSYGGSSNNSGEDSVVNSPTISVSSPSQLSVSRAISRFTSTRSKRKMGQESPTQGPLIPSATVEEEVVAPVVSIVPTGIEKKAEGETLSPDDVELLIETTFALVVEMFDLTTTNNKAWMRRSLLNLIREIVRRLYTELVAEQYNDYIQTLLSPDALTQQVTDLVQRFWPDGRWSPGGASRTDGEIEATRRQARTLLIQDAIPNALRQLIGDQNCSLSMERVWQRLQDPALNRVVILQLLERTLKPIFG